MGKKNAKPYNYYMLNFSSFGDYFTIADKTIGDVTVGEDGRTYAVTLDNSGQTCWTCVDDTNNLPAIIISLLKTIKWSAHYGSNCSYNKDAIDPSISKASKRKKTAYNQHIGQILRELASKHPTMPRKERMRIAVDSWKSLKSDDSSSTSKFPFLNTTQTQPESINDFIARRKSIDNSQLAMVRRRSIDNFKKH